MDASRRLLGWLTGGPRGRPHGLQVFEGCGAVLAGHLEDAQSRAKPGQAVRIAPGLAREITALLRALADETPSPYVVSFVHDGGWRAEMRLAVQRGRLVVSALHVTPEQADHIPPGGLTARGLRRVPLHSRVAEFARALRRPHDQRERVEALLTGTGLEDMLSAQLGPPRANGGPTRTGRRPIQIDTLLRVAAAYAKAVAGGSARPVEDAARTLAIKMPRVRDLVHRARRRGLLTPAAQGRSGGELTPRAKALLSTPRSKDSIPTTEAKTPMTRARRSKKRRARSKQADRGASRRGRQ